MNLILIKLEIEMQNLNIIQRNHSLCIQEADLGCDQIIFQGPGVSYIVYWVLTNNLCGPHHVSNDQNGI